MTFRVGQKVVCVTTAPLQHRMASEAITDFVAVGSVYTIREIGESPAPIDRHLGVCLRFEEITNRMNDWPFGGWRFRPIVERKTDISVFTEILRKATKPARVPSVAITQQDRQT